MKFRHKKGRFQDTARKGIYVLPNALTLCGMFCGFFAIIQAVDGNYLLAAWAIVVANIFDGLDGWIARLTNTSTRFGVELDSLSDLVAFGVAPAVMMYKWALLPFERLGWAAAFLFAACGALRLARFNVQTVTSSSKSFKGLPIPGAATVIASLVIFYYEFWQGIPEKHFFFPLIMIVTSLLMVSTLKFHGLKEIDFREKKPFWLLILFVAILFFLLVHPQIAIFVFAMIYVSVGIIENTWLLLKRRGDKQPAEQAVAALPDETGERKNEAH
ncbi:MAG TPA: CDP-diacylglycerol--serine O-phosphatidyltransferase [Dissulfurispiraceae bacterium]|nr:CDP-diacylglycerol--serine O-phosphatidyltransferase [Dissulfurispiraceae bacterium]